MYLSIGSSARIFHLQRIEIFVRTRRSSARTVRACSSFEKFNWTTRTVSIAFDFASVQFVWVTSFAGT